MFLIHCNAGFKQFLNASIITVSWKVGKKYISADRIKLGYR